jgi:hypothetical protein
MRVNGMFTLLLAAAMTTACDRTGPVAVVESPDPSQSLVEGGGQWTLTTYYWADDGWVRLTAIEGTYLPMNLRIAFNAHNWGPEYPAFWAEVDNFHAYGEIDFGEGLFEDFEDGAISTIWEEGGGSCVYGWGAQACVAADRGVLVADVPPSTEWWNIVGLSTGMVVHGEFDVQMDFSLDPGMHDLPDGRATVMLCMWDESYHSSICAAVNSGFYSTWKGIDGTHQPFPLGVMVGRTNLEDTQGKLRITRTRMRKGGVEESVVGSGSLTTGTGAWRTFSFSARRYADGTVDGVWERIVRPTEDAPGSRARGIVGCFNIVGNQVWLAGHATGGAGSEPPNRVGWRVVDNGDDGSGTPDQISLQWTGMDAEFPAWYCASTFDGPDLYEVEAGNIKILR